MTEPGLFLERITSTTSPFLADIWSVCKTIRPLLCYSILSLLLQTAYCIDDSYWKPTESDVANVVKASFRFPSSCESAQYQFAKQFLAADYFDYPEDRVEAKFGDGEPYLTFRSKDGVLREFGIGHLNPLNIVDILRQWGFKKDAIRAKEIRTEIFNRGRSTKPEEPAQLMVDENGNLILPSNLAEREKKIANGEMDPNQLDEVAIARMLQQQQEIVVEKPLLLRVAEDDLVGVNQDNVQFETITVNNIEEKHP